MRHLLTFTILISLCLSANAQEEAAAPQESGLQKPSVLEIAAPAPPQEEPPPLIIEEAPPPLITATAPITAPAAPQKAPPPKNNWPRLAYGALYTAALAAAVLLLAKRG
ncbi:MAG: hypothetical protein LBR90_00160 [Elusimicrobiota bacterium]|nr:hypothetical protein [Elusimicrobiota bacterium]